MGATVSARELFAPLGPTYDRYAALLSFGQDPRWRRFLVSRVDVGGSDRVLDVATGTGAVARELLRSQPDLRIVGLDQSPEMLAEARRRMGDRVELVTGSAEKLPFEDGAFDALTFTYLLRYVADPATTLGELARVLKPGAPMASLEFLVPRNAFWRAWWWLYTRLVLPAAGVVGGRDWIAVGRFLGPNISAHYRRYPVAWTVEAWRDAGMTEVGVREMSLGGGLVMWGTKRGE